MATFDADAYRAAREPFTLVVNGRTHVARPVSAELVIRLQPEFNDGSAERAQEALRELLRAAFPYRIAMWWLGDPVTHAMRLDPPTRRAMVLDFFRFLGGATASLPATPGTR